MKRITLTICTAAFLFASCGSKKDEDKKTTGENSSTTNDAKVEKAAWIPVDSATMDKMWKENMALTDNHKMLAKANGNWSGEVTMWMADGAPPMKSTSTSVTKTVLNLYQQTNHTGDMMGMPFEGQATMGYDNLKKEFFSTWIDNMGSGIMMMSGQYDAASKSITLVGSTRCMNGQDAEMKEVYTMKDDDNHVMEMYGPDPATGKQYKNMEIKYTRKK